MGLMPPPPPLLLLPLLLLLLLAPLTPLAAVDSAADDSGYCLDLSGNRFPGEDVAFFLDQRDNCTIMMCRGGKADLLLQLCDPASGCRPVFECPDALLDNATLCDLPSGERGAICPPAPRDVADYPKRRDPGLGRGEVRVILRADLPEPGKRFLLSRPPQTADGKSRVERILRQAVRLTSDGERQQAQLAARDIVQDQEDVVESLVATGRLPKTRSSTVVFNLNFHTSPAAQRLGLQALRELNTARILVSTFYETPSDEVTTQPTSAPSSTRRTFPTRYIRRTFPTRITRPTGRPYRTRPTRRPYRTRPTGRPYGTRPTGRPHRTRPTGRSFNMRPTAPRSSIRPTYPPLLAFPLPPTSRPSPTLAPRPLRAGARPPPPPPPPPTGTPNAASFCICIDDEHTGHVSAGAPPGHGAGTYNAVPGSSCSCEQRVRRSVDNATSDGPADLQRQQQHERHKRSDSLVPALPCLARATPVIDCNPSAIYRTANGQCNNLVHPEWGRQLTALRRLFANTYADGLFQPTASATLPDARLVSEMAMDSEMSPAPYRTLSVMTWGQFMDHDLVHSPIFQLGDDQGIECCLPNSTQPPPVVPVHPQCFPIEIRDGDAFYGPFQQRCMNFVRTIPAPTAGCPLGPANQLNDVTHWIDGSQIYGSDLAKQESLREMSGGRLLTSAGNLLPREKPGPVDAGGYGTSCRGHACFIAGDSRVNENPILAMYHTIFMREHNRIAQALQVLSGPGVSDEELFQRARRIVVAELQHISYNEWLPALIGYSYAQSTGILTSLTGHSNVYLPFLNPNIANSFATAGFRLHSLVQELIEFITSSGAVASSQLLRETYFEPSSLLSSSRFVRLARSVSVQMPQSFDRHFTNEIRGQLFSTGCFGLDLVALNIQRGRGHGIAKYTTILRWCTNIQVKSWGDLVFVMPTESIGRLQTVYSHWDDIDAYAGMNMERLESGAMLGPTARCLLTEQFLRLRYGDRFFYDLGGQPGSFTLPQLKQLRLATWARILCDNAGDDFSEVQRLAFFQPHAIFNPVVDCNLIPSVDLTVF